MLEKSSSLKILHHLELSWALKISVFSSCFHNSMAAKRAGKEATASPSTTNPTPVTTSSAEAQPIAG